MKNTILTVITLSLTLFSCHNTKKDYTTNLDGQYFFSEGSNLSYYVPNNFTGSFVKNDKEFDSLVSTIKNPKLIESINNFYRDGYVHPEAYNAQYFFREQSNSYTFLIINEIEHIRLNEKDMDSFKYYRNSLLHEYMKDSSATIDFADDRFTNRSDYQIMTSRGRTKTKKDSVFWEFYIISKFLKTFTIMTKSSEDLDFQPFINAIEYGDKRDIHTK